MAASNQSDELESKLRSMILQNTGPAPDQKPQPAGPRGGHQQHRSRGSQNFRAAPSGQQPQPRQTRGHHGSQPSRDFDSPRGQGSYGRTYAANQQRGHHHVPQASRDNVNWRVHANGPAPQVMQRPPVPASQHPQQHQSPNRSRGQTSRFVPLQRSFARSEDVPLQCQFLEDVARVHLPSFEMSEEEFVTKDKFRLYLQHLLQRAVTDAYPHEQTEVTLHPFGSISSGFAMPGSDMDLALHSTHEHPDIFRVFQKVLLDLGIGARILSRTRVPIIKICELPTPELLAALRDDREQWDKMTPEEREAHDDGRPIEKEKQSKDVSQVGPGLEDSITAAEDAQAPNSTPTHASVSSAATPETSSTTTTEPTILPVDSGSNEPNPPNEAVDAAQPAKSRPPRKDKPWYREKRAGPLDFPKSGVGIQCDINYENPLGIQNSLLLRCYSHCDVRVRLLVLFVKGWASKRKINSSYSGTLSSYGFVLMVMHYLVNVAHPPVCPNLQTYRLGSDAVSRPPPNPADPNQVCAGYDVRFWRAEQEILSLAGRQMLTHNREPLGALLRGFFQYYAQQGSSVPRGGFAWTQHVLSLRTPGGIITKAAKGWTGATTTVLNVDGTTTVLPNTSNATSAAKAPGNPATPNPKRHSTSSGATPSFAHGTLHSASTGAVETPTPAPASAAAPLAASQASPAEAGSAPAPTSAPTAQDPLPPGAREVRNRYLFAIEDPFETTHNVARTVTHPGIVAIRDEFRRAWRILQAVGRGQEPLDGNLMEPVVSVMPAKEDEDAAATAPPPTAAATTDDAEKSPGTVDA